MKRFAVVFLVMVLGFLAGLKASSIADSCLRIPLMGLDGKQYTLEDFRGKTSLLIFWRSTCPHCRAELPRIKELVEEIGDRVNIIAVSLDTDDEYFKNYIEELKPNFPIYRSLELRPCIGGIRGVPTLFVLDENLNIIKKFEGTTPNDEIKKALNLE